MIPASYLFKTLYQDRFERELPAQADNTPDPTPRNDRRGSHHPAIPFLALLGLFGLAR